MKVIIKKCVLILFLGSMFVGNLYPMNALLNEKENKNNEKEKRADEFCENVLKNFQFTQIEDEYISPKRSKLMLQKPKMSDKLADFIYDNTCPEEFKDLIISYKKLGASAFTEGPSTLLQKITLLYGPNGTGKSTLGILLAKKLGINLFFINSGFLGTMYKDSAQTNMSELMQPVIESQEPCVVVMDEADAIVGKGGQEDKERSNRSAAIAQMIDMSIKKPNVIIIWTTNELDQIESKFKSRIGSTGRIIVPEPIQAERKAIVDFLVEDAMLKSNEQFRIEKEADLDTNDIAIRMKNYSIRDIEESVKVAIRKEIIKLSDPVIDDLKGQVKQSILIKKDNIIEACSAIGSVKNEDRAAERKRNFSDFIKNYGVVITAVIGLGISAAGIFVNYHLSSKRIAIKKDLGEKKIKETHNRTIVEFALGTLFAGIAAAYLFVKNPSDIITRPVEFARKAYFQGDCFVKSLFLKKNNK